ncbi:unnamed protein product, partial [Closterium sp. NIES-53]
STFPPWDSSPALFSAPRSLPSPPVVQSPWTVYRSPGARHSSPVRDLRSVLLHPSPPRSPPPFALPLPPSSALAVSSPPLTVYYSTTRHVVSSFFTKPTGSPSSVSALTTVVTDFAATRRLDYATRLVAAPPTRPLYAGGECALGFDILEDKQFELEFLAAASPHLCSMLVAPEGEPDAPDIPTSHTYTEAVSGPWASQWIAAMDAEMASWRSTRTRLVSGTTLFRSTLADLGFSPSSADLSLFVRSSSTIFFALVYVDNLVFNAADRVALAFVKSELQKRYTCTDLSELRRYHGLQIIRDKAARTITLTQSHMAVQGLPRFELHFSTTQPTPLAVDHTLTAPFPDEPFEPSGPYAELVGCLMYLMILTHPDLAYPLSVLARFIATRRHRHVHWTAAAGVAKYMATTPRMGLVLGGAQPVRLTGHYDSSYGDDLETDRSSQGYCFSFGFGAVSWRSTRLSSGAQSSAEAEIYAGAMAT